MPNMTQQHVTNPNSPFPRLHELSMNVWWSWTPVVRQVFENLDQTVWRQTHHNPVKLLQEVKPERLASLSHDIIFTRQYQAAVKAHDEYMTKTNHWFGVNFPEVANASIGYFSAEFGLHNSIPIYSGGLGVLAGDHLKEASDLGIPLVGVSFMYSQAYFRQVIGPDGWQQAVNEPFDRTSSAIQPALLSTGEQCQITVQLGHRPVHCLIWFIQVGRIRLYLLDTDVEGNQPEDRALTARLYGGDQKTRLCQEVLLGIGGVRALRSLGIQPRMWHANEGHAAFLNLERMRELLQQGVSYTDALSQIRDTSLFTTHTPVPAGHDVFSEDLMDKHFSAYWTDMGLSREDFFALGQHPHEHPGQFHMTALAIRLSSSVNGVSEEHGRVSRTMWQSMWPERPEAQVPIHFVTNGVHVPTWIAPEMCHLYSKYLGPNWQDQSDDSALWHRVLEIPDHELWEVRKFLKRKLLGFIRQRIQNGWTHGRLEAHQVLAGGALLNPYALTIGFGRRFATYKRANLLFYHPDRLKALLHNPWQPVQFVFAGKAHPADKPGQELIHEVYQFAKQQGFGGHITFLEDYDMHVAKFLVQGVDVWLNNPRPPLEASGTSGQKAALNGVPNLSVLDGWWKEGYDGSNGWAFPLATEGLEETAQDHHDAESLLRLLEQEVIPLYYQRDQDGIPHGWVKIVKNAIRTNAPRFSARRMLKDYVQQFYVLERTRMHTEPSFEKVR
jgi:glycogen phosphorylase